MKKIKYHCSKCGHTENLTGKERFTTSLMNFFSFCGCVIIIAFILAYTFLNFNLGVYALNEFSSYEYTNYAKQHDMEIRDVALNLTHPCSSVFPNCYASMLYARLKTLRYVPTSKYRVIYHPIYVYENGGDCKNSAMLVVALMESLGFEAEVICNIEKKHCITKIPIRNNVFDSYDKYIIIDLAMGRYEILNKTVDIWDFY